MNTGKMFLVNVLEGQARIAQRFSDVEGLGIPHIFAEVIASDRSPLRGLVSARRGGYYKQATAYGVSNTALRASTLVERVPGAIRTRLRTGAFLAFVFIVLSSSAGFAAVHYVAANGVNPVSPYRSWATAATNIQDAVDAASAGDEIIVTNGTYASGSGTDPYYGPSRVTVTQPLWVHSVNGAGVTTIQGSPGPSGIRCVQMANGGGLSGFTLTSGSANNGGGLVCSANVSVSVSNCVIVGNSATNGGGGAYFLPGSLLNCIVSSNSAAAGGGIYGGTHTNCLLVGNWATYSGGGVYAPATLYNCTIVGNSATNEGGGGYGINDKYGVTCVLVNSIIYSNTAAGSPECVCTQFDCCSPQNNGFTQDDIPGPPQFVDLAGGNFRLMRGSPGIDAGDNRLVETSTDLDGNPRIRNGVVDMGAYEFQAGASSIAPAINVHETGNTITLAWPLWASNFVAQEAGALPTNSGGWSNVAAIVSQTANENTVIIPSTNSAQFFRLFLP